MSTVAVKHQPLVLISSPTRCDELDELADELEQLGFRCQWAAGSPQEIAQATAQRDCCLVLFAAGAGDEVAALRELRDHCGEVPFAVVCADGTLEGALAALRLGACDFISRPFSRRSLELVISASTSFGQQRTRERRTHDASAEVCLTAAPEHTATSNVPAEQAVVKLDGGTISAGMSGSAAADQSAVVRAENPIARQTEAAIASQLSATLVGRSPQMEGLRRLIARIASTEANVMIHGESGTGKEVVAAAIHRHSRRADGAFVPVNMSAIPAGCVEEELFGRRAANDASRSQAAYCFAADGGTLFLDEIGAIEMRAQPALLRFLQDGLLPRRGTSVPPIVDTRIITATNRTPSDLVRNGELREDLYYQLHVAPIHIPALRERREDIADLAELFLQRTAAKNEKQVVGFTPSAMEVLQAYDWPGNTRQLKNTVENLVILGHRRLIDADEVPVEIRQPQTTGNGISLGGKDGPTSVDVVAQLTPMQRHERAAIVDALNRMDGHVVRAARLLGVGQATVYRKIRLYGIPRQRSRRPGRNA